MALRLANAKDWPAERILMAGPGIVACIQRIVDEAPEQMTVAWLLGEVNAGRQDLWLAYDDAVPDAVVMVALTAIMHYPATGYTFCRLVGLGGERLDEVLPFLDDLEAWAKAQGAQEIEPIGRDGWARVLEHRGYVRKSTVLAKRLT